LLLCLWAFSLWAFLPLEARAQSVEVTDSAGRHVTIPATVQRVMPAGPPAALLLYALAPDKLIGWPSKLPPETAALLPKAYAGLPVVGRLTSSKPPSAQSIRKLHPDLILDIGDVEPDYAALADKIQRETGIPYLLFDGRLAQTPEILRRLGPLLGQAAAGQRLAGYAEGELKQIAAGLATLPPAQRPGVYYARGGTGLQTGPAGSLLGEIVDMAGGHNLVPPTGSSAPAKTTLAEIARWDPDVVITQDPGLYRAMPSDPAWGALRAVQSHRIHLAPELPFGWIDEPPGINRLLGLRWLAAVLHPETFAWDRRAAAREFCELFYHAKLGDAEIDRILASPP
ncbi:MAG TPA: ABC transporter substrate-binding protein, partial [Dongiaceae bacterium]|nr:ABC transporter substrate-binding protein [Dongiaceae bacterium]